MSGFDSFKFKVTEEINRHWIAVCVIILIVLVGYHKILWGANFFLHEDFLAISNYSFGNSLGNGWRPDKGFGISAFFGEGIWHPWSLLSLWENVTPSREFAYTSSVVVLGILAALAQYFFIRAIIPNANKWLAILLAPLVVFCADQGGYHFLRLSITQVFGIPMLLLLLFKYYINPRLIHLFLSGLLFWFVAAFGNLWNVTQLISIGFVFTILYGIYYEVGWVKLFKKYVALHLFAGISLVLLSAWVLYPFFLEKLTVGYMREKAVSALTFAFDPNLKGTVSFLVGLIQAEWFEFHHNLAGLNYRPFLYTYNVSSIFPLIFIYFAFRRSQSFWEFALKWLLFIFLIHAGLIASNILPGYRSGFIYLSRLSSKLITMYDFVFPLQVALIAIFVMRMRQGVALLEKKGPRIFQIVLTVILILVFLGLAKISLFALFNPTFLPSLASKILTNFGPEEVGSYSKELLNAILVYNIEELQRGLGLKSLLYYLSSVVLLVLFIKNEWLDSFGKRSIVLIAALFLVNNVFLSWTAFPLNEKEYLWNDMATDFKPTDRFYLVLDESQKAKPTVESFKKNWSELKGGETRDKHLNGLLEPPALSISGLKSFATKKEGQFIYKAFTKDGKRQIKHLRLYYGGPLVSSELLDMGAVNYYYSEREIPNLPSYLSLYAKKKQLYIYKNKNAWDYFYLAKSLKKRLDGQDLKNVVKGTAYINTEDTFELNFDPKATIELKEFKYGDMLFDFKGRRESFLVVADAWHPYWKATAKGKRLPVLKTNEIFKGVRLPPGQYNVRLYFDTTSYRPGIYISFIAWIVFIFGFGYAYKHKQKSVFNFG